MSSPTIASGLATRYDLSWMEDGDEALRLERGLQLARNLVGIAYAGAVQVDWAAVSAPFEGVMIREEPLRILLNPRLVLARTPGKSAIALDTLCAVTLHEASHAAFTSSQWGERATQLLTAHRKRTGRALPSEITFLVLNWMEDIYIEDQLVGRFPGFAAYFRAAWDHFLPTGVCRRRLTVARQRLAAAGRAPASPQLAARLVMSTLDLLLVAVQQPDRLAAEIQALAPAIADAARQIQNVRGQTDLDRRLVAGISATDTIIQFLSSILPALIAPHDHGSAPEQNDVPRGNTRQRADRRDVAAGPGAATRTALDREIRRIRARRITPHWRDDGDPLGTRRVDRRTLARLSTIPGRPEPGGAATPDPGSATTIMLEDGRLFRLVDSSPDTLPSPPPDAESIAGQLFDIHRGLAEELRRRLRFRDVVVEQREYGQRRGTLDDDRIALVAAGARDIFYQRSLIASPRVDLTVLIDESGSMKTASRWRLAAAAIVCLEYALRPRERVRLRVYGYTGDTDGADVLLFRHYDSGIPRLRRPSAFGYLYPKGTTPTGHALAELHRVLSRDQRPGDGTRAVLLVSDGCPEARNYRGSASVGHVASQVRLIEQSGMRFAALQIGTAVSNQDLDRMYGRRWQRVVDGADIPHAIASLALVHLDV